MRPSRENPVGDWYGLRKGYRGRFGMYLPPLQEALGLAELTWAMTFVNGGTLGAVPGRRDLLVQSLA